ncbi:hypothetical protein JHK85_040864 [Glycine max]|nr:hypothetical protein JHK86_040279 [Glycine max]KAG4965889.1 hypothetical protein JHK85_040864 [Glycine max]
MPPSPPSSTTPSSPPPSSGSPAPDFPSPSPTNSSSKPHRRTETPSFRTPSSPSTRTRGSVTMPRHSPSTTTLWCSSSSPTSSARTSPPPTTLRVFVRKKAITFVLRVFDKYPDAVRGKSCMLVAGDVYKPAAIDQLAILGKHVDVPVYTAGTDVKPSEIAKQGLEEAKKKKIDVVIVDTTALVTTFNPEIGITGAILTKLDADSRGGAALSFREVLDPEVAVNKEEYQVFDEIGRGRFGTVFRCFQHRGLRRHQNGGLGGWWCGGGGCRQRGDEKEAAAGEEVIVVVVVEEVVECVDPAKKKELDGLRAEMPVALAEGDRVVVSEPVRATVGSFGAERFPHATCKSEVEDWRGSIWWSGSRRSQYYLQDLAEGSTLYGFKGGPYGIMKCKYVELTSDYIYPYRNQKLDLDGLVVIGGDNSNTNACLLACLHGEEEKLNLLLSSFASHFTPRLSNSRVYADS